MSTGTYYGALYTMTEQGSSPSTPAASDAVVYFKDDSLPYYKNDAGTEIPFSVVTGGIGKNAIINGDMTIAQRGTSFAAIVNGFYTLDRWRWRVIGTAVHTVTQDTDVPTVAQAGRLFTHSMKLALTTADTAIAAGDVVGFSQAVEGYNWRALAQRIITLSFWFKSPITGIHCVALRNTGTPDRSCVKEFTVNVANTWEKKTLTFPASPSAGTWDYTNGIGIDVVFVLACGSTFQTTADSYQTGNFFATANQVNGVNTGITPYFITGVQLEAGSVATEFEGRQFGVEDLLCKRYYLRLTSTELNQKAHGQCFAATGGALAIQFPVPMRATPTGTFTVGAGSPVVWTAGGGSATITSYSSAQLTTIGMLTQFGVAAGLVAGDATFMASGTGTIWEASAEL